jgi:thiamine kinase-like enzyme
MENNKPHVHTVEDIAKHWARIISAVEQTVTLNLDEIYLLRKKVEELEAKLPKEPEVV